MDPTSFTSERFGNPVESGLGFWHFEPIHIPRSLDLSSETVYALSSADDALGRLASAGRYLPDPTIFVRPYIAREALASSRIEGTQASLDDVFQAEAADDLLPNDDVAEVLNYIAAVDKGVEWVKELPVSRRLVSNLHAVLMQGVRGEDKLPGQVRRTHVYIGSPTDAPQTAVFVPPLPNVLPDLLEDWERFANEEVRLPVLIQCGLLHYQFETIHPFLDGNGRVGRLLIVFFLMLKRRLFSPLLYLSAYLEEHRREYYERLQAVRERGEIDEWLQFFLTAVTVQATDASRRSEALFELRERYRQELVSTRSLAPAVVDLLFENPVITAHKVQQRLEITNQGALKLLRSLQQRGWLHDLGVIGRPGRKGGRTYWVAQEVHDAIVL